MEYCEGGDLGSLIKECQKQGTQLSENFVWHILYQTGRAVQACHSLLSNKTVIHRDIKPANVFLDSKSNVKLGDFGLACTLDRDVGLAQSYVGTPYYMSPEVVFGNKYTKKSDVWSLGCLVYQMCALTPPFHGSSLNQLALNIRAGKQPRIPSQYTDDLQHIVSDLLTVKQDRRPTIETIIQHPVVVSNIINNTFDSLACVGDTMQPSIEEEKISVDLKERLEFQNVLLNRLEGLKLRESLLREKELVIEERERALEKREKEVTLLDRLTRETMSRANVYLRQCRDSRSLSSGEKNSTKRCSILQPTVSNIDTSLSADPGDTSILPTSCKLKPSHITRPFTFVPSSERHVRFSNIPITEKSIRSKPLKHHQPLGNSNATKVCTVTNKSCTVQNRQNGDEEKLDPAIADNFRNNVFSKFNSHSAERLKWLASKRQAYSTLNVVQCGLDVNNENVMAQDVGPQTNYIQNTSTATIQKKLSTHSNFGHFR